MRESKSILKTIDIFVFHYNIDVLPVICLDEHQYSD